MGRRRTPPPSRGGLPLKRRTRPCTRKYQLAQSLRFYGTHAALRGSGFPAPLTLVLCSSFGAGLSHCRCWSGAKHMVTRANHNLPSPIKGVATPFLSLAPALTARIAVDAWARRCCCGGSCGPAVVATAPTHALSSPTLGGAAPGAVACTGTPTREGRDVRPHALRRGVGPVGN